MQINIAGGLSPIMSHHNFHKQLKLRNPNILEGKSVEAVYAFAATEWGYVHDSLA